MNQEKATLSGKVFPLAFYYSWPLVTDDGIPNVMAEFSWNGAENLVFSHLWSARILKEPSFAAYLKKSAREQNINLSDAHAPLGHGFELCCPQVERRPGLIEDHKKVMACCADCGCRTYTMHVGSVDYGDSCPVEKLRANAVEVLEQLLPAAEKLNLIIAVENCFEPSSTPDDVAFCIEHFNSPYIRCCFDTGHAHLMEPAPGKTRDKYWAYMDHSWGKDQPVREYTGALEKLAPYLATCHLHDNNGCADSHSMPGTGSIHWQKTLGQIKACPSLISMQTEVKTTGIAIGRLVQTFRNLTAFL